MKPPTLECSQEAFEAVHRCVDATRATSTTVRVPKEALEALLRDHGVLLRYHKEIG